MTKTMTPNGVNLPWKPLASLLERGRRYVMLPDRDMPPAALLGRDRRHATLLNRGRAPAALIDRSRMACHTPRSQ